MINEKTEIPLPGKSEGALRSELIVFAILSPKATAHEMRARFRVADILEPLKEGDAIELPGEQAVLAAQLFGAFVWGKSDREVLTIADGLAQLAGQDK